MAIESCQQIFEQFPQRFNPEGAGDWNTVIQFHISGDKGGDWALKIHDGQCELVEGTVDDAKATVKASDDTFIGLITGKVNPMMAFTLGKVKVKGAMGEVMKLNNPAIFQR